MNNCPNCNAEIRPDERCDACALLATDTPPDRLATGPRFIHHPGIMPIADDRANAGQVGR